MLLGVKVVASTSPAPLYSSDSEFRESVKLDGPAGFWNSLGLPNSLHLEEWMQGRVQRLDEILNRLLIAYALHLDCEGDPPDPRWRAFANTVRVIMTDVLNIFSLAASHFRELKREPYAEEVKRYWGYTQTWSEGDLKMERQIDLIENLTRQYREFYQVSKKRFFSGKASSHEILLPLSTALEIILRTPTNISDEDIILQGAGQLFDVIDRKRRQNQKDPDVYLPLLTKPAEELESIRSFMEICVKSLLGNSETKKGFCQGDRALLQENRNRIKSGAEFAYRWLTLQESKVQSANQTSEGEE
jgi:CRISPR-associated protein Csc3